MRKTKADRIAEEFELEEKKKKEFLETRERRFFNLIKLMGENTDIFKLPELTIETWDQLNFKIILDSMCCPYYDLVMYYQKEEHFKFYESDCNFTNLELAVQNIIKIIRDAQAKEKRIIEIRKNALEKLTEEERKVLGVK